MTLLEAAGTALSQLRAMLAELEAQQSSTYWVFDSGLGKALDQTITQAKATIRYLEGEGLERVTNPGAFKEGVTGAAAWDHWRDMADALGKQLALALGTLSRWSAGEVLRRVAYDLKQVAASVGSALPWASVALAALALIVVFGGRR